MNRFLALLSIYPGEGKLVGRVYLHFFLLGLSSMILCSAAFALFVERFGAAGLAWIYLTSAVVAPLGSMLYMKIAAKLSLRGQLTVILATMGLVTLLLATGLAIPGAAVVAIFLLPVWYDFKWFLDDVKQWEIAGQVFDIRQGKRLFGLIGSGTQMADIAGAALVPLLVPFIGAANLLFVSVGILGLAAVSYIGITRACPNQISNVREDKDELAESPVSAKSLLTNRHVFLLLLVYFLSSAVWFYFDNLFYSFAEGKFTDADQLATFIAIFTGISSAVGTLAGATLSGRLLIRFGVKTVGLLQPLIGLILIAAFCALGLMQGELAFVFVIIVAAKGLNDISGDAATSPATRVLYQPLVPKVRSAVSTVNAGVISPIAGGVAGGSLLLFTQIFHWGADQIGWLTLGVIVVWFGIMIAVTAQFPQMLKQALKRRFVSDIDLDNLDPNGLEVMASSLARANATQVAYVLTVLEEQGFSGLSGWLVKLAGQGFPTEVQIEALKMIESLQLMEASEVVGEIVRASDDTNPELLQAAILAQTAIKQEEGLEEIKVFLTHQCPEARDGALIAMMKYGGISGIVLAGQQLLDMQSNPDPQIRCTVANCIGEIGDKSFYQPLLHLLNDSDRQVKREALLAAGKLGHPRLLPPIFELLKDPMTRSAAMATVSAVGEPVLPRIHDALKNPELITAEVCVRLIRACEQIRGKKVIALLEEFVDYPNLRIQGQITQTLKCLGYRVDGDAHRRLESAMKRTAQLGRFLIWAQSQLQEDEMVGDLILALEEQLNMIQQNLLSAVSILQESKALNEAGRYLQPGVPASKRGVAIEAIEVGMDKRYRDVVMPFVDQQSPVSERLARLDKALDAAGEEWNLCHIFAELISDPNLDPWLRACAIQAAGNLQIAESSRLSELEKDPIPMIRETAHWAITALP